MTDNKEGAEKKALKILNAYTRNTKYAYGWELPLGLIGDIEKAINEAYAAGVKAAYAAGVKAERERITQKIIDMQFAFPGFANKTVDRIVESIRQEPA